MSERSGPIERQLRSVVAAYLQKYGHGAASTLGRQIGRPSFWVGQFARGSKRAGIDEAVALVEILALRPNPFVEAVADLPPPAPRDKAQARREARWLRLLYRLEDPDLCAIAFSVVERLARKSEGRRGKKPPTPDRRHK